MPRRVCSASRQKRRLPPWSVCSSDIRKRPLRSPLWRISGSPPFPWGTATDCAGRWGVPADEVALRFQLLRLPGDFGDFPFRNIYGRLLRYIVVCATIVPCSIPGCHTELQLKSLEKILRQHRTIRQEVSARIFDPIQSSENGGILYVFPIFGTAEVEQKRRLRLADAIVRCCLNCPKGKEFI